MRLLLIDGPYYLHRSYSVALLKRDPKYVEKNVLTLFLSMVVADIVALKATHVAATFDAPNCFRYELFPKYKANRKGRKEPVMVTHPKYSSPVRVDVTASDIMPDARKLLRAAGIAVFRKSGLESDDLLGSFSSVFQGEIPIVVSTRDKDMGGLVNDRVSWYWPMEKKMLKAQDVLKHYGVLPFQMRDYLSLMGDKVDNIPGVPGVAAKTAASMLGDDTLKNRLKVSKKLRARLQPHISNISMAQKLTTLKIVPLSVSLDDLIPKDPDKQAMLSMVWAPPKDMSLMRDARQAAKYKGLFGIKS